MIAALGTYSNSADRVLFNTTGLQTGVYFLSDDGLDRNNQFELIGRNKQEVDLIDITNRLESGVNIKYSLQHNTSRVGVNVTNVNINGTFATANLSTQNPGQTSISLNTYAFGNESLTDGLITAGPNATVESINASASNGTLPPGEYRIEVRSEQGLAATTDEATVTIGNRSTNGMRAYATTDLDREDLRTADAVRRAIANGTLSSTSTVAPNETVAYAVNATGLSGLPAARDGPFESGSDLARLGGLAFGVRSNASTTATEDGGFDSREAVPRNASVHVDEGGLYVVAEGDDALATDETPADGEAFTAEFGVEDDRLREAAADPTSDHAASTTVSFEAPPSEGSVDSSDESPEADAGRLGGGGGG
ncbi:hypothetical protein EXE53_02260, partial [Halorubrum sp. SD626R]